MTRAVDLVDDHHRRSIVAKGSRMAPGTFESDRSISARQNDSWGFRPRSSPVERIARLREAKRLEWFPRMFVRVERIAPSRRDRAIRGVSDHVRALQ